MPVRLTGLWNPSQPGPPVGLDFDSVLARFPAEGRWTRLVRRTAMAAVALDVCGDRPAADVFAESSNGDVAVAGTIRLDGRGRLQEALGHARGHEAGDAGIIVSAYQRWGMDGFARLRGDFAFALWDRSAGRLCLVRDPFGVRRLHFASPRGRVVFSTEIEGVLAWPEVDREVDDVTILDNLLGRYQTRTRTFLRSIRRVAPGHLVRFGSSGPEEIRYARPPEATARLNSYAEYSDAFRHELDQSIAERLPGAGKVVCHVSGGLDSTSIAGLAAAQVERSGRSDDLILVNARFPGFSCDEGAIAAGLAAGLGLSLHQWEGTLPEVSDLEQPRAAWPFGRMSIGGGRQGDLDIAGRFGASVLLSGEGGNQVTHEWDYWRDVWREGGVAGYGRALKAIVKQRFWEWEPDHRRRLLGDLWRTFIPFGIRRERLRRRDPISGAPPAWLGPRCRAAWSELQRETVPASSTAPATGSWMSDSVWEATARDPRLVWVLEHEDARATERGVEIRYPFLSWSLMALVMSVPGRLRPPAAISRSLHREAMKGVLPDSVRLRTAFVFFNHVNLANCEGARPVVEEILGRSPFLAEEFVDRRVVAEMLKSLAACRDQPFSFETGASWRLVRDVAALEAWLEQLSC